MKNIEVANLLGSRPETVSRWNQGRAYPHASTEKTLLELEYIVDQLADFYEPNEARQWIFAPQKLLAGASPAKLIRNGRIDEVCGWWANCAKPFISKSRTAQDSRSEPRRSAKRARC